MGPLCVPSIDQRNLRLQSYSFYLQTREKLNAPAAPPADTDTVTKSPSDNSTAPLAVQAPALAVQVKVVSAAFLRSLYVRPATVYSAADNFTAVQLAGIRALADASFACPCPPMAGMYMVIDVLPLPPPP